MMLKQTKYTTTPSIYDIKRNLIVIDAKGKILGRLAVKIAQKLQGKGKFRFVRNIDMGDIVVVINAAKIRVTGRKMDEKEYSFYSGYPGGLRKEKLSSLLTRRPDEVIRRAVAGMLPKNKLRARALARLFVFSNEDYKIDRKKLTVAKSSK